MWRSVIAVVVPAVVLVVAFPAFHHVTTVYNEPANPLDALLLALFLTLLPGIALAAFVRSTWLFATGVVLSAVAAAVVAAQIATTDDAQAGLAALALPIYLSAVVVIVAVIDRRTRKRVPAFDEHRRSDRTQ